MRGEADDLDGRFAAFVRGHGERHLRLAVLLTGDWHAAEDLVQASLLKLYQAWPRLETDADPDAYLRRIMVNTHRSWWRTRWRREKPVAAPPEGAWAGDMADAHATGAARQAGAQAGSGAALSGRVSGAFDPVQRTGEETLGSSGGDGQIRFIGPYVYLYHPANSGGPAIPSGKSWVRAPSPQLWEPATADQGLNLTAGLGSLAVTSPQNLFALLK